MGYPVIDSLVEDITCSVSRARFEELCMDYFVIHGQVSTGWHPTCATRRAAD